MLLCWRRRAPGGNGWARNGCRVHRSQQPQKRGNSSGMALCTSQHTNRSGTAAATAAGRYLGERSGRRSSRHQQVRGKQLLVGSNRYKKVASGSNREPGKRNRATGKWEQDQLWYNRHSKHSPKWNVKQNPSVVCKSRLLPASGGAPVLVGRGTARSVRPPPAEPWYAAWRRTCVGASCKSG